jgi:PhzF family phenazine biosynthesis protein
MTQPIYQVDSFTNQPFAGNPAGVCILPAARDAAWMLNVAREMNLAETAFLVPQADGYDLRWFTPTIEMDLCGHATLASAHILWETKALRREAPARFHTKSGLLTCVQQGDVIEMDFPATPPRRIDPPDGLLDALGVSAKFVGQSKFDYLVEVESEEVVRAVKTNLARLSRFPVRGAIVTSRASSPGSDFVSRFFAPAAGVDEDPVTGSAHCTLSPYWSERLGRAELTGYQASARGGVVHTRLAGDRVMLGGQAVTVLKAELLA